MIELLFELNGCRFPNHTYFGGGFHLTFSDVLLDQSTINDCHYLIRNVSFVGNCAELGGGVFYLKVSDRGSNATTNNSLLFDNCTFTKNTAHIGSAVDVTPNIFFKSLTSFTIVPIFKNCYFLENFVSVNYSKSI